MRVVLLENVEKLGLIGEEKEVKRGFARNWLLPQKLAVYFNDPKAKEAIKKAKIEREKIAKEIEKLKKLATELIDKVVVIKAKTGVKGKLFGTVRPEEIAKKIKVDKKQIEVEPIKELGEHEVLVKFGHGIETKIKVVVEAEEIKNKK